MYVYILNLEPCILNHCYHCTVLKFFRCYEQFCHHCVLLCTKGREGGRRGETTEEKWPWTFHDPPDSTSNYFDYKHEPQQPGFYLGFGVKHRALRELYRHSTTWTTSPGQKFINNSRRRKFRVVLRLARECTCFLILKIHGKLLVAEKWGFGNIKLYLKLIVMNSWTIFKGLGKWFPYSSQTSCELGKVTAQTMWKSKANLTSVDFVSI